MSQTDRVHKAIRDAILAHNWPAVTYTTTGPLGTPGVRVTSVTVPGTPPVPAVTYKPNTVLVKPILAAFRVPQKYAKNVARERDIWEWQSVITFPSEVSWEDFEEQMMATPILLLRTATLRQVRVFCEEIAPQFPPEQNASSGTRLVMRWLAEESLI